MKRIIKVDESGLPLRVIRPDDPAIPLRIARECTESNDAKRLANLPCEAQEEGVTYYEIGFLALKVNGKGACVVTEEGEYLGPTLPGDSFITKQATGPFVN